ncbi:hypothetical protein DFJ43DRAFT_980842, partial [Lentinula guzmanii]
YYKRPDLNDDETVFIKYGWFRTGDVGQWNEDGVLSLIDRVKILANLQGGKMVERLEFAYKARSYIGNICAQGTADAKRPVAIVVPHKVHL